MPHRPLTEKEEIEALMCGERIVRLPQRERDVVLAIIGALEKPVDRDRPVYRTEHVHLRRK